MIEEGPEPTAVTLDITGLDGFALRRALVTAYVNGFDTVELGGDRVTTAQRRTVQATTAGLVGAELLEGTGERITVENLLDGSNLTVTDAVARMRGLATSMLEETIAALVDGDRDLAHAVVKRDDDVDRLWLFVARTFRGRLHSPEDGADTTRDPEAVFEHHTIARQLERVADSAAAIARLVVSEGPFAREAVDVLADPGQRLVTALEEVLDSMETDARNALAAAVNAHDARTALERDLRELDERLPTLDPEHERTLGRVGDALARTASHVENLGEVSLGVAYPSPDP